MSKELTTTNQNVQVNNMANMVEGMAEAYKYAQIIAKSDLIPAHYRGKPENTLIAMETAFKMGLDYRRVMDNSHLVNGKLGWSSQFCISRANRSGLFSSCMKYRREGTGDNMVVTAYLTEKASGEEISFPVGMKMAIAENWVKNPKYKSMPEVMLGYRAATFLIRTHTPEVLEGMQTLEELEDMKFAEAADITPKPKTLSSRLDALVAEQSDIVPMGGMQKPEAQKEGVREYDELAKLIFKYNIDKETTKEWLEKTNFASLEELPPETMQKWSDRIIEIHTRTEEPTNEFEGEAYE